MSARLVIPLTSRAAATSTCSSHKTAARSRRAIRKLPSTHEPRSIASASGTQSSTLSSTESLPFSSLIQRSSRRLARLEVLVTFLAVLELLRQAQITAWQQGVLGEIFLVARATDEAAPAPA